MTHEKETSTEDGLFYKDLILSSGKLIDWKPLQGTIYSETEQNSYQKNQFQLLTSFLRNLVISALSEPSMFISG